MSKQNHSKLVVEVSQTLNSHLIGQLCWWAHTGDGLCNGRKVDYEGMVIPLKSNEDVSLYLVDRNMFIKHVLRSVMLCLVDDG